MLTDLVIDADGHCNEPWEDLTSWMPKAYHRRAPLGFADRHGTTRMYVASGTNQKRHFLW